MNHPLVLPLSVLGALLLIAAVATPWAKFLVRSDGDAHTEANLVYTYIQMWAYDVNGTSITDESFTWSTFTENFVRGDTGSCEVQNRAVFAFELSALLLAVVGGIASVGVKSLAEGEWPFPRLPGAVLFFASALALAGWSLAIVLFVKTPCLGSAGSVQSNTGYSLGPSIPLAAVGWAIVTAAATFAVYPEKVYAKSATGELVTLGEAMSDVGSYEAVRLPTREDIEEGSPDTSDSVNLTIQK